MSDLAEAIIELQTRIQFQDDTIQKLDEVVVQQAQLLERLQRRIEQLDDRLEQLRYERETTPDPEGEKPPHY